MSAVEVGFVPDGSIPQFLSELPTGLDEHWILIPWLDSGPINRESPTIRRAVAAFAQDVEWSDAGLVLRGCHVAAVLDQDTLFAGFDEVVVFDHKPSGLTRVPVVFTSDADLSDEATSALCSYLDRCDAVAAAGDGVGLRWFRRDIKNKH
jgi:hypothetical protein